MKKNCVFLKWVGGKYFLFDDIKWYLFKGECLVEFFVGVGLVFFNIDFFCYIFVDDLLICRGGGVLRFVL